MAEELDTFNLSLIGRVSLCEDEKNSSTQLLCWFEVELTRLEPNKVGLFCSGDDVSAWGGSNCFDSGDKEGIGVILLSGSAVTPDTQTEFLSCVKDLDLEDELLEVASVSNSILCLVLERSSRMTGEPTTEPSTRRCNIFFLLSESGVMQSSDQYRL